MNDKKITSDLGYLNLILFNKTLTRRVEVSWDVLVQDKFLSRFCYRNTWKVFKVKDNHTHVMQPSPDTILFNINNSNKKKYTEPYLYGNIYPASLRDSGVAHA